MPKIAVPWWLRWALKSVQLLPVPVWIKAVDTALIALIDALPDENHKAQARVELDSATLQAVRTNSSKPIKAFAAKHCEGVACPADLVSE